MTDKLLKPVASKDYRIAGLLQLDIDSAAERFMVVNRKNGRVLRHEYKPANVQVMKMLFHHELALNSDVLVILLDDNREFNAAIADGVQLELVDANQVDV